MSWQDASYTLGDCTSVSAPCGLHCSDFTFKGSCNSFAKLTPPTALAVGDGIQIVILPGNWYKLLALGTQVSPRRYPHMPWHGAWTNELRKFKSFQPKYSPCNFQRSKGAFGSPFGQPLWAYLSYAATTRTRGPAKYLRAAGSCCRSMIIL